MLRNDNQLLPTELKEQSISNTEIVLPKEAAIEAINYFKEKNIKVLGWEGWTMNEDSQKGHGNAPQGTLGLEDLDIAEAADFCIKTIKSDYEEWFQYNKDKNLELYFCLTIDA